MVWCEQDLEKKGKDRRSDRADRGEISRTASYLIQRKQEEATTQAHAWILYPDTPRRMYWNVALIICACVFVAQGGK